MPSSGRVALFARAVVLLLASRVLLARRGTTVTLNMLSAEPRTTAPLVIDPTQALWAIRRAGRLIGGACLPQSVALVALLHRLGADPVLILGCSRIGEGSWTAHAWVELGEEVLEPVKGARHARLACLEAHNGWAPAAPGISD